MAKQRTRKKTTTVTLVQVYDLAKDDEDFLAAVLKDPKKALAAKGCKLTPDRLKALKNWLMQTKELKGIDLLRLLMEPVRGKTYPWP